MMLWHQSRLGSLLVGVIALRKYECIEYAGTVSSSAVHPSETSDEPIGFFWWWLICFFVCLLKHVEITKLRGVLPLALLSERNMVDLCCSA